MNKNLKRMLSIMAITSVHALFALALTILTLRTVTPGLAQAINNAPLPIETLLTQGPQASLTTLPADPMERYHLLKPFHEAFSNTLYRGVIAFLILLISQVALICTARAYTLKMLFASHTFKSLISRTLKYTSIEAIVLLAIIALGLTYAPGSTLTLLILCSPLIYLSSQLLQTRFTTPHKPKMRIRALFKHLSLLAMTGLATVFISAATFLFAPLTGTLLFLTSTLALHAWTRESLTRTAQGGEDRA